MTLITRTPNTPPLRTAMHVALVAALVAAVASAAALGLGLEISRRLCGKLWPHARARVQAPVQWAGEGEP